MSPVRLLRPEQKISGLQEAVLWRESLRSEGLRLVVTNGCFDLLHRGHVDYLFNARALGDALMVFMNSDASVKANKGPGRPLVGQDDRAFVLAGLSCVDRVIFFDEKRCDSLIEKIRPDIYVKGGDYTMDSIDPSEKGALISSGAEIVFVGFVGGFSTTSLIKKIEDGKNV